jgi:hypothetical protein
LAGPFVERHDLAVENAARRQVLEEPIEAPEPVLFLESIRPWTVSAMPRMPSYLSSKSQAGSSNGSLCTMG